MKNIGRTHALVSGCTSRLKRQTKNKINSVLTRRDHFDYQGAMRARACGSYSSAADIFSTRDIHWGPLVLGTL